MKIVASLILLVWFLAGLFFGIGGLTKLNSDETMESILKNKADLISKPFAPITVNGLTIDNEFEYEISNERDGLEKYFTWTVTLPRFTALTITALSFGLLGAVISLFKDLAFRNKTVLEIPYLSLPLLGILTGLVVLGLSYLLPTLITKGSNEIRPITLMFLCLFCGICADDFYKKIEKSFDKLFAGK